MLYTEEAATEEECLAKILRAHKIERRDFNDKIKIIRVRKKTRGAFLGMLKKNVVEITYIFAPQFETAISSKKAEYSSPAKSAAVALSASPSPVAAAPRALSSPVAARRAPLARESSFDENRKKLLTSVLEANPEIKEKVSSGNAHASAFSNVPEPQEAAGSASHKKAGSTEKKARVSAAQLDLLIDDDFVAAKEPEESSGPVATDANQIEENLDAKPQAASEEMQAILQEVREISRRIEIGSGLGNAERAEHRNITRLMDILELNDFSPSFMNGVREKIRSCLTIDSLSDFDFLQRQVLLWTGASIKIAEEHSVMRPHIIVLVGPTGAGKTTTVAKLAAAYIRAYKKSPRPLNVKVITIDNYRIGAKQHLEKYGEIMGVTVSSAETPQDLHKLVGSYQDEDIILIDTTGRSPKDHAELSSMCSFFDGLQNSCETLLTVSACTKTSDMHDIIRQYGIFQLDGLIITKFDETSRVGNIVSMLAGENLPVAYITTGQRVPKDFEAASVMKFLFALEGFSVDISEMRDEFPDPEKRFEWS